MHLGVLLPWNEAAGGGMSIRNCTVGLQRLQSKFVGLEYCK